MAISNTLITSGTVDILTVPALTSYAATGILLCNYGVSDETITVYARVSGAAVADLNTIMKSFVLPAGNTYQFDFKLLLATTDKISIAGTVGGLASATITYLAI